MTGDLLFWLFVLALGTIRGVRSLGYIETNFQEFVNFEGKRFDGNCCDKAGFFSWFTGNDKCTNECEHTFVICMGNATQSSSMSECEFGKKELDQVGGNEITFNSHVGTADNPIKFQFGTWPGVVKLKIDVHDTDGDNEFDFVDHYEYQYNTRDLRRKIDAPEESLVLTGSRTRFDMKLKVYCELNFYGPECGIYCKETDDETGHYRCDPSTGAKVCKQGWKGDDCLTNIDDCVGNRCFYGATCIDGISYYRCQCPPGRTGFYCEAEINECASAPCKNGGKCFDASNSFICECAPGFVGLFCEVDIDECSSGPCLNGGVCIDKIDDYLCVCQDGFSGERCEVDLDECLSNPCVSADSCTDLPGDYMCDCFPGFMGKNCEHNVDECASDPCENSGACIDKVNSFQCKCQYGFTGKLCESRIDYCDPNYCMNGATCLSLETTFECQCTKQFTGLWCESDINECDIYPELCNGRGICANTIGNYFCSCMAGYEGKNCEIETDECLTTDYPCLNGGLCIDLIGRYHCECSSTGFYGTYCEKEVNECESHPCQNGGSCKDNLKYFYCECPEEFTGITCETRLTTSTTTAAETTTTSTTSAVGKEITVATAATSIDITSTTTTTTAAVITPQASTIAAEQITTSTTATLKPLTTTTSATTTTTSTSTIGAATMAISPSTTAATTSSKTATTAVATMSTIASVTSSSTTTTTSSAKATKLMPTSSTTAYSRQLTKTPSIIPPPPLIPPPLIPPPPSKTTTLTFSNISSQTYESISSLSYNVSIIQTPVFTDLFLPNATSTSTSTSPANTNLTTLLPATPEIGTEFLTSTTLSLLNNMTLDQQTNETDFQIHLNGIANKTSNKINVKGNKNELQDEEHKEKHLMSQEIELSLEDKSSGVETDSLHESSGEYESSGDGFAIEIVAPDESSTEVIDIKSYEYVSSGQVIAIINEAPDEYESSGELKVISSEISGEHEYFEEVMNITNVASGQKEVIDGAQETQDKYDSSRKVIDITYETSVDHEFSGEETDVSSVAPAESFGEEIDFKSDEYKSSGEVIDIIKEAPGEYEASGELIYNPYEISGEHESFEEVINITDVASGEYESSGEVIDEAQETQNKYDSSREVIDLTNETSGEHKFSGVETNVPTEAPDESSGEEIYIKSDKYKSSGEVIDIIKEAPGKYEALGELIYNPYEISGEHESFEEVINITDEASGKYESSGEVIDEAQETQNKYDSSREIIDITYETSGDHEFSGVETDVPSVAPDESSGEEIYIKSDEYKSSGEVIDIIKEAPGEYEASGELKVNTYEISGEHESFEEVINITDVASGKYESSGEVVAEIHETKSEYDFSREIIDLTNETSGVHEFSGKEIAVSSVAPDESFEQEIDIKSDDYKSSGEEIDLISVASGDYEASRETIYITNETSGEHESIEEEINRTDIASGNYELSGGVIDETHKTHYGYESSGEAIDLPYKTSEEDDFPGEEIDVSSEVSSGEETYIKSDEQRSSREVIEIIKVGPGENEASRETIGITYETPGKRESFEEVINITDEASGKYVSSGEVIDKRHEIPKEYEPSGNAIDITYETSGKHDYSGEEIDDSSVAPSGIEIDNKSDEYVSSGDVIDIITVERVEYEASGETLDKTFETSFEYESFVEKDITERASGEYESAEEVFDEIFETLSEYESSGEYDETYRTPNENESSGKDINSTYKTLNEHEFSGEEIDEISVTPGESSIEVIDIKSDEDETLGEVFDTPDEHETSGETKGITYDVSSENASSEEVIKIKDVASGEYKSLEEVIDETPKTQSEYKSSGKVIKEIHERPSVYEPSGEKVDITYETLSEHDFSVELIDMTNETSGKSSIEVTDIKSDKYESTGEEFDVNSKGPGEYEASGEVIGIKYETSNEHKSFEELTDIKDEAFGEYETLEGVFDETLETSHDFESFGEANISTYERSGEHETSVEVIDIMNTASGEYESSGEAIGDTYEAPSKYESLGEAIDITYESLDEHESSGEVIYKKRITSGEYESFGEVISETHEVSSGTESLMEIFDENVSSYEYKLLADNDISHVTHETHGFAKEVTDSLHESSGKLELLEDIYVSTSQIIQTQPITSHEYRTSGQVTKSQNELSDEFEASGKSAIEHLTMLPSETHESSGEYAVIIDDYKLEGERIENIAMKGLYNGSGETVQYEDTSNNTTKFPEHVTVTHYELSTNDSKRENVTGVIETSDQLDIFYNVSVGGQSIAWSTTTSENTGEIRYVETNYTEYNIISSGDGPFLEFLPDILGSAKKTDLRDSKIDKTKNESEKNATDTENVNNKNYTEKQSLRSTQVPKTETESIEPRYSTKIPDNDINPWLAAWKHINFPSKSLTTKPKKYEKQPFNPWLAARRHLKKVKSKQNLKTKQTTSNTQKVDLKENSLDTKDVNKGTFMSPTLGTLLTDTSTLSPTTIFTKMQDNVNTGNHKMTIKVTQVTPMKNASHVQDESHLTSTYSAGIDPYSTRSKDQSYTAAYIELDSTMILRSDHNITWDFSKTISSYPSSEISDSSLHAISWAAPWQTSTETSSYTDQSQHITELHLNSFKISLESTILSPTTFINTLDTHFSIDVPKQDTISFFSSDASPSGTLATPISMQYFVANKSSLVSLAKSYIGLPSFIPKTLSLIRTISEKYTSTSTTNSEIYSELHTSSTLPITSAEVNLLPLLSAYVHPLYSLPKLQLSSSLFLDSSEERFSSSLPSTSSEKLSLSFLSLTNFILSQPSSLHITKSEEHRQSSSVSSSFSSTLLFETDGRTVLTPSLTLPIILKNTSESMPLSVQDTTGTTRITSTTPLAIKKYMFRLTNSSDKQTLQPSLSSSTLSSTTSNLQSSWLINTISSPLPTLLIIPSIPEISSPSSSTIPTVIQMSSPLSSQSSTSKTNFTMSSMKSSENQYYRPTEISEKLTWQPLSTSSSQTLHASPLTEPLSASTWTIKPHLSPLVTSKVALSLTPLLSTKDTSFSYSSTKSTLLQTPHWTSSSASPLLLPMLNVPQLSTSVSSISSLFSKLSSSTSLSSPSSFRPTSSTSTSFTPLLSPKPFSMSPLTLISSLSLSTTPLLSSTSSSAASSLSSSSFAPQPSSLLLSSLITPTPTASTSKTSLKSPTSTSSVLWISLLTTPFSSTSSQKPPTSPLTTQSSLSTESTHLSAVYEKSNNTFDTNASLDYEKEELYNFTLDPVTEMFNKEEWTDWLVSFMESSTSFMSSLYSETSHKTTTEKIRHDTTQETTRDSASSFFNFSNKNETFLTATESSSKLDHTGKSVLNISEASIGSTFTGHTLSEIVTKPFKDDSKSFKVKDYPELTTPSTDSIASLLNKTPSVGTTGHSNVNLAENESTVPSTDVISIKAKKTPHGIPFTTDTTFLRANETTFPADDALKTTERTHWSNQSTITNIIESSTSTESSFPRPKGQYSSTSSKSSNKLEDVFFSLPFTSPASASIFATKFGNVTKHSSQMTLRGITNLFRNTTYTPFTMASKTAASDFTVISSSPAKVSSMTAERTRTLENVTVPRHNLTLFTSTHVYPTVNSTTIPTTSTRSYIEFGTVLTQVSESGGIKSDNIIQEQTTTDMSFKDKQTTSKLSVIRHRIDLTSNNTYPNPKKETFEYIRNTKISKGNAKLTFKKIKVTVIRTYEEGKRIVYRTYQKVKDIATTVVVTTYEQSRKLLEKALQRVEALWQYCKTGINHYVVKPLLDARVLVKNKFEQTYSNLSELFNRGKTILKGTANDVRAEASRYFKELANYYTDVYRQYSTEVRDIFESLKVPDS